MSLTDVFGVSKKDIAAAAKAAYGLDDILNGFHIRAGSDSRGKLSVALKAWNISTKHFNSRPKKFDERDIFCNPSMATQKVVRTRYFKKCPPTCCAKCNWDFSVKWNNEKCLTPILDHIDGDNRNCLESNLRWVCGNCNSILPTTCVGKKGSNRTYSNVPKRKINVTAGKFFVGGT